MKRESHAEGFHTRSVLDVENVAEATQLRSYTDLLCSAVTVLLGTGKAQAEYP
jgi:hypothetical protein